MMIQAAGPAGTATRPTTSFERFEPLADVVANAREYRATYRPRTSERALAGLVQALHRS